MAFIQPFAAIRYARNRDLDLSKLIAPPFDVLDEAGKKALQARHPNNIVTIDLPHLPPKAAGPDEKYVGANITFESWLGAGILARDARAAFYPYTQTFEQHGRTFHRRGFFAAVRLSPFGQGQVVPHEKTYQGAIEDRLALMRAMRAQMSPIFGLYNDPRNEITNLLYKALGKPEHSGTLDGIRNDLWHVNDAAVINQVSDMMRQRPIYIADGHHRYTTALTYQKELQDRNGGPLPPNHPANFCMFVLIGMQDDGLLILPTHRLIGGLSSFDLHAFKDALGAAAQLTEVPYGPDRLEALANDFLPKQPPHTFAVYDGGARKTYLLTIKDASVLTALEPGRSDAWRKLDVAILQRFLLDEIIKPRFAGGKDITLGYTADASRIAEMTDGSKHQLAIIIQSTPLHALEELGKHNEVMPQKSTYFYPKLATGMVINPLRT